MGSVFDFPGGVDLAVAAPAEKVLRAAGLSRRAALALIGLGVLTPRQTRLRPWEDWGDALGLSNALARAANAGPATADEVRRWREIPWAD